MICTFCQAELRPGTHVCTTCGHPVSVNPAREDLYFSRLASSAPPALVRKVRSAPYLAKDRRTVTAIMISIANIADLNEKIPSKDRIQIQNKVLDRIAKLIYEYEGSIAKLWENTLLAFFGAPVTHEDDPLRAVHAASLIIEEVQSYSVHLAQEFGIGIQVNMVINTGPILIGDIKSNLKFDFQSLNNTLECMDLAIQAEIPPCEVVLFEDTYRFIRSFVKGTKLEGIYCEEIDADLNLWRVDEITTHKENSQRLPISQTATMVGRQKELDILLELSETVLVGATPVEPANVDSIDQVKREDRRGVSR